MNAPRTVEFYCGNKSFSKQAELMGMQTFTVDIVKSFKPDLRKNMWYVVPGDLPYVPDIIWASPDCTYWSCRSAFKHWNRKNEPQTLYAERAMQEIQHLLALFLEINPAALWYLENPRGKLRKMPFMEPYTRHTVTYCQYGDTRRKPTDIWTNNPHWKPKPECDVTDQCHTTLTTDLTTARKRAAIPGQLINEILLASSPQASRI